MANEHMKICVKINPRHKYVYNNLAFIYNMHTYYTEAIRVCNQAKMYHPDGKHMCHRHWAFALFKNGETSKAIKKIKKAATLDPYDPENWIVWGLIMRTVGYYDSARHKFNRALVIDPDSETV